MSCLWVLSESAKVVLRGLSWFYQAGLVSLAEFVEDVYSRAIYRARI